MFKGGHDRTLVKTNFNGALSIHVICLQIFWAVTFATIGYSGNISFGYHWDGFKGLDH